MGNWVQAAKLDEIGPGGKHVLLGDEEILLVRRGDEVFALGYLCSHQDMELEGGEVDGDGWVCPHHGARFALDSGEALSMPAFEPVPTFPVKVEAGVVFIEETRS